MGYMNNQKLTETARSSILCLRRTSCISCNLESSIIRYTVGKAVVVNFRRVQMRKKRCGCMVHTSNLNNLRDLWKVDLNILLNIVKTKPNCMVRKTVYPVPISYQVVSVFLG